LILTQNRPTKRALAALNGKTAAFRYSRAVSVAALAAFIAEILAQERRLVPRMICEQPLLFDCVFIPKRQKQERI
jgi:hypothetical protein